MAAVIPSCAAHRTVPLPAPATPHMHMHSYMAKLRRPAPPPSVPYAEALRLQGGAPAVDRGGVSSQQLAELKERLVALAQEKEQALLDCQVSVEAQRCLRQELLLRCDCSGCCSSSRLHFSCYCPPSPNPISPRGRSFPVHSCRCCYYRPPHCLQLLEIQLKKAQASSFASSPLAMASKQSAQGESSAVAADGSPANGGHMADTANGGPTPALAVMSMASEERQREDLIRQHYESRMNQLTSQVQFADSKAIA